MSGSIHLYQVTEDDLCGLELALSLIARQGTDWKLTAQSPVIREAWQMVQQILVRIRFEGFPPKEYEEFPFFPTPPPPPDP